MVPVAKNAPPLPFSAWHLLTSQSLITVNVLLFVHDTAPPLISLVLHSSNEDPLMVIFTAVERTAPPWCIAKQFLNVHSSTVNDDSAGELVAPPAYTLNAPPFGSFGSLLVFVAMQFSKWHPVSVV